MALGGRLGYKQNCMSIGISSYPAICSSSLSVCLSVCIASGVRGSVNLQFCVRGTPLQDCNNYGKMNSVCVLGQINKT